MTEPQDPLAVIEEQLRVLEENVDIHTMPDEEYIERLTQATHRLSLQVRLAVLLRKLGPQPKHRIPSPEVPTFEDPSGVYFTDGNGRKHHVYNPTTRDPIREAMNATEFALAEPDDTREAFNDIFPVNSDACIVVGGSSHAPAPYTESLTQMGVIDPPAPDSAPAPEVFPTKPERPYPDDFNFGIGGIHLGG